MVSFIGGGNWWSTAESYGQTLSYNDVSSTPQLSVVPMDTPPIILIFYGAINITSIQIV